MATSEAAKEALYLSTLVEEVGFPLESTMKIFISDPSVTNRVYEPDHEESRHIDRRHGFLQELQTQNRLTFPIVNEVKNLGKFFDGSITKRRPFLTMRDRVMNVGSRVPSGHEERGGVATT